jgi:hypothetical protein
MTRALCAIRDGVSVSKDVPLLTRALRMLGDAVDDPGRVESRIHGLRRSVGAPMDEGSGIRFERDGFEGHIYSWSAPIVELEFMVTKGLPRPVRLRHPMPHRLTLLRDRRALSDHLARMADLVAAAIPDGHPRSVALHERQDRLAEACAALASIENIPGRRPVVRLEAPSPFRRGYEGFGHLDGDALQPSRAFLDLQRRRLPHMVQLSRNNTGNRFFELVAVATHVTAEGRSMPDVLRAAALLPADFPPVVEWRRP